MSIGGEDLVGERITENGPQRANAIFPIDFFSFGVGSSGITDGHFKNAAAAFGELDGEFRLDVEGGAVQRNAFQQVRAHHLVAGFHVCQVEVADHVAQEGEEFIAQLVAEEEGAFVSAGHEARTKDGIGVFEEEEVQHLQQVARMVFQVGIVNYDEVGIHVFERGANGRAFAHIFRMLEPDPGEFLEVLAGFQAVLKTADGFRGGVRRAVVYDDTLICCKRGDSSRTARPFRLASIRYCSL